MQNRTARSFSNSDPKRHLSCYYDRSETCGLGSDSCIVLILTEEHTGRAEKLLTPAQHHWLLPGSWVGRPPKLGHLTPEAGEQGGKGGGLCLMATGSSCHGGATQGALIHRCADFSVPPLSQDNGDNLRKPQGHLCHYTIYSKNSHIFQSPTMLSTII